MAVNSDRASGAVHLPQSSHADPLQWGGLQKDIQMHKGKMGVVFFFGIARPVFTYTSPTVEKRSSSTDGRDAAQTVTEVFGVWDMLEIQCESHQSEMFLDAMERDRL